MPRLLGIWPPQEQQQCPRYGKSPLPKPDYLARAPAVTLVPRLRRGAAQASSSDEEEEMEEEEEEDSHEDVCHGCSSTGELFCCAECPHAYCDDCLPLASRTGGIDRNDWRCPVCTGLYSGGAVGNPQTGRKQACGKARARKRGRADPTPSAGRAIKHATYANAKTKSKTRALRMR